ncbi:MAG: ROK family protein [Bacteroidales bacterium]|nr:ROK family protein [Bacteroidales bacterium]
MYEYATAIGVDIGRTMIRTSLVRYGGKILSDFSYNYNIVPDRESLIAMIIDAISRTRTEAGDQSLNPLCVGIAAKGFVNYLEGIIYGPDQGIAGWKDVPLASLVKEATGLPAFIDNDANLMAIAEHYNGAGQGYGNIIFVALRSGIGGAIIIDGKLYRGADNAGGEIGQMSLDMYGNYSDKGIRGSFEYFASSVALVRNYLAMSGQMNDGNENMTDKLRARDIFELSYEGDHHAKMAVRDNANYVGAGLANLISIFSPDIIILGGGMAMARDEYFEMITESAASNTLEYCRRNVKIVKAKLGFHASLMGAGIYALTRLDGKHI